MSKLVREPVENRPNFVLMTNNTIMELDRSLMGKIMSNVLHAISTRLVLLYYFL